MLSMMSLENPCGLQPTLGRYIGKKMLKIFVDTLDKETLLLLSRLQWHKSQIMIVVRMMSIESDTERKGEEA